MDTDDEADDEMEGEADGETDEKTDDEAVEVADGSSAVAGTVPRAPTRRTPDAAARPLAAQASFFMFLPFWP
ncbi:hypothetical protein HUT19_17350 [Streptomyces sp. NA02950]|uniref:hypothetical protein n=1 Tax=Streptomyces sp. NA02950 TaxID=2742137 RepID=UPI00159227F4|nr:hypothetical protein [Streptomyces sp. NA02950]QKV93309.1 hypothetical protein HUT19_17350 [Streptomyces sp. NA02950]